MPERTPVLKNQMQIPLPPSQPSQEKSWVRAETLTVVGVDPGWANHGMVALRQVQGQQIQLLGISLVETEKDQSVKAKHLRVSIDDGRRLRELWDGMDAFIGPLGVINSIGVEAYAPFKAQGGNSWKSSMAYTLVHGYAYHSNILVQPALPLDLKKSFGLAKGASKTEIGEALFQKIPGLHDALLEKVKGRLRYAEGKWEHLTDAAGHAYLALLEIYRMRKMVGVNV